MSEQFKAFSFVDKIHADEIGVKITGSYHIPENIEQFPLSLVAEAIGQLAAMSSMKAVDFQFRPVAGIAGAVDFTGSVKPGDTLELEATLSKADEESVNYDGVATVNGEPVVVLHDSLGPMVPMADFSDPAEVSARYDVLTGDGAEADVFGGVSEFSYEKTGGETAKSSEGQFTIPSEASFFGDHFPRNPVFPGTLLMNLNLRFALDLVSELEGGGNWEPVQMSNVKLRDFMPPGETLDLQASVAEVSDHTATVRVQTRKGKKRTSSAQVLLRRV